MALQEEGERGVEKSKLCQASMQGKTAHYDCSWIFLARTDIPPAQVEAFSLELFNTREKKTLGKTWD